jgi:coenzyme F420-reducing hydrogenase delta subunit
MLDYLGIERERTKVAWISAAEGQRFAETMNEFTSQVASLGKNKRLEDLRCKN